MSKLSPWFGIFRVSVDRAAYDVRMSGDPEMIVIESRSTRRQIHVRPEDVDNRAPFEVVSRLRSCLDSGHLAAPFTAAPADALRVPLR